MAEQVLKRHPVRGGIWGIPTGLGLALLAVNSQIVSLSITTLVVGAFVGIAIGALWASFGPAKKPKGSAPTGVAEPIADAGPPPLDPSIQAPVGDPGDGESSPT